ncbi:MAG TPA: AzlC family ABC transporter permease, partial [Nitrolancea sp.]
MQHSETPTATNTTSETSRSLFRRGFVGLMPLWTGAIPVGIAYAVAARGAGLSFFQTELMSLTVFSAAAQLSAVALLASGSPVIVVMLTALSLNLQAFLLGLTAARSDRAPRLRR